MIRTIAIKTEHGHDALMARVDANMKPEELVLRVRTALREFKTKQPERYAAALVDGKFPWSRLFTHMDQGILESYGIDLRDYGQCWLEIEDDVVGIE